MAKHKRYPVRIPNFAAGIRAQETRAGGGRRWWSRRWMQILEGMGHGGRLGRGKNYAISGQITDLSIAGPHVEAVVVGTRSEPYKVTLNFRVPEGDVRNRIIEGIKSEPMLVARMVVNDLPTEVEMIFKEEGFALFPGGKLAPGKYDMTTHCSCPDYANPCKHIQAVLIILGEEISRRPATLLELRGIELKEVFP
jgi:uncharacterized Zn finger protein